MIMSYRTPRLGSPDNIVITTSNLAGGIGSDWIGWLGLHSIGLDGIELDGIELDGIETCWTGMVCDWIGPDWVGWRGIA